MFNVIQNPIKFFTQLLAVLPPPIRLFLYWSLGFFAFCFIYSIVHYWLKG